MSVANGDSGGGLFDMHGDLIAMIVGRGAAGHQAFVIPMSKLESWLR